MKRMLDEREKQTQYKIVARVYQFLIIGLGVSILIQQLLLNAPPSQYMAEVICFVAASLYSAFAKAKAGILYIRKDESAKKKWFGLLVALCAALASYYFLEGIHDPFRLVTFGISFSLFYLLSGAVLKSANERSKQELDKGLDEEDEMLENTDLGKDL